MTPNLEHLERLQALTKEYGQFSKQNSGLAYIVMFPLLFLAYWFGEQLPTNWWGSLFGVILSGIFSAAWLFVRWRFIQQFYQSLGFARVAKPEYRKGYVIGALWGITLSLSLMIILRFASNLFQFPNTLIFVAPIIVFSGILSYLIYQKNGFMVAANAFALCAVISGGIHTNATNLTDFQLQFNGIGLGRALILLSLISISFREHQQFKTLEQKFKNLGSP
jgi:hypothetical protein